MEGKEPRKEEKKKKADAEEPPIVEEELVSHSSHTSLKKIKLSRRSWSCL